MKPAASATTASSDGEAVAGRSAIACRGVTKRFPGVLANDRVDFDAAPGEVHALLGENGAGKSTLSNILTGLYRADEGQLELYGSPVSFDSPRDALDAGICMVHQHFRLVETFTVAENVVLGDHRDVGKSFRFHPRAVERRVGELAERYGLPVEPRARIWQLSVGEQQRVEILKALHREARILILDEPTAVLTPQEAETLFETLRLMAAEGRTVIFISHKLHEVIAVADRVTVLRGGRSVAVVPVAGATPHSLAALMVGRDIDEPRRRQRSAFGDTVLSVEGLSANGDRGVPALHDISLTVRGGEILGIAGVAGNGQRELAETLTGMRPATSGVVRIDGRVLRNGDSRAAIAARIGHIPEDRLHTGVASGLSIGSNTVLKSYRDPELSRGPLLRLPAIAERAQRLIRQFDVVAPNHQVPARQLSGGNLQKVVIGREFLGTPRVLIAAAPTRGLDVGAIENVHGYIHEASELDVAVVLISEDLDEVRALADRIVVMYEGRIAGEVDPDVATVEEIGLLMAGGAVA